MIWILVGLIGIGFILRALFEVTEEDDLNDYEFEKFLIPVGAKMTPSGEEYAVNIINESLYQEEIDWLSDLTGHRAQLITENDNVIVVIDDDQVGDLSPHQAKEFIKAMADQGYAGRIMQCRAKIVGGHELTPGNPGMWGVRLEMVWPPIVVD